MRAVSRRRTARYGLVAAALAATAVLSVTDYGGALIDAAETPRTEPQRVPAAAPAELEALRIAEPGPMRDYSRRAFGQRWSDDVTVAGGHNGCDTRNDQLREQLRDVQLKPGTRGCVVLSGTLLDPYTGGRPVTYRRGAGNGVDVDHVVALADAWRHGARDWTPQRRADFANDPANLIVTSTSANRSKGDRAADQWMPDRDRCGYARAQIRVKTTYGLSVTRQERAALGGALETCGNGPKGG